jgi:hypothetical protein
LSKIGAIRERDFDQAGFNARELGADQSHDRLLLEAFSNFVSERGI